MSQFIEMFYCKDYPLVMIKSVADVTTGGTPSKAHPEYWNGDKPWVSAEDMKSKYVYDTSEKLTDIAYDMCKLIPVDTLMYVCRGSIGIMAINKIECATNQSICRAKCNKNVCNVEYLYHALMYQRDSIKQMGTGTSFKSLNQTTFSEIQIKLPPYDEQMKYVRMVEQADKSKFGDFKSQFIEMYYNTHNKQTLESVCPIMSKGITPKYVESSSVLVINQACIHWDGQRLGNIKYHNEEIPVRKRILESGDVLLNATGNGTLGRCCVFICPSDNNTYINDGHVIALSTDRAVILPEVLNTYLSLNDTQAEIYRQYVTGSTNQVDIVFSDIKKMKVPVPSMDEQILFVEVLKQADKSKSVIQKALVYLNDIQSDELGKIA
jgi:restriction endonuclease S subunit